MKVFQTESLYDATTGEWVERYLVDGHEVEPDLYFYYMDQEDGVEDDKLVEDCCEIEDEVETEECDCNQIELTDQEIEEAKLIASYVQDVLETEGCPGCIFDILTDLFFVGKEIGWSDHRDYMREVLED